MPELSPTDPLRLDVGAIQRISAVPDILRVVQGVTGLRFAAVARVTDDQWVACAVSDQLGFGLAPHGTLEVKTTLCSEVRHSRSLIVMDQASTDPAYCGHDTPKMYGFESYVSVPIFVSDGSFFGTICALDPLPAKLKNAGVLDQLTLLAQLIATQLDVEAAAAATRAAKARLQSFVMGAPGAIAVLKGPDLVFELANDRFQSMVSGRAVMGRPGRPCVDPDTTSSAWDAIATVYRTGESYVASEYRSNLVHRDDPGDAYVSIVAQPTFADGVIDGVIVFVDDVSATVEARERLERKNRELDHFAYVASHDLKSPLRGIGNLAQWIETDAGPLLPAASREHLGLLQSRVLQMNRLIDGILRFARTSGSDTVHEALDVGALLGEVATMLDLPHGVTIDSSQVTAHVSSSRVAMQQVFLNLVSNAMKYAGRPDCHITVGQKDVGDDFVFSVSDNGPGIAPKDQERIWGLFESVSETRTERSTGIGLSIVRKIVEARGGKVWIESELGKGATFFFSWPKNESTSPMHPVL